MKMCVFGLNHSNLSCGALPRAPGWLCRPTKPKPETRNPAAEWAKPETQAGAEKRNPKPKPGRNPVRGRRLRGGGGVARGGHARGTRLQLRVERFEQPAAQPRVLSDERDELGRGAALRLAVDVEAAPFVTLLDVAAGQVDAEHALLALGGDRVRRDLW